MYQLMDKIARKHSIEQTLYVNFEDPAFLPYLTVDLLEGIYDTFRENVNPSKKAFIFLDEVQNIPAWEKWVRSYYDKKENVKFIISGSSSKLLSSEFSTLLTGRSINFEVFPLSFKEFLDFKGMKVPEKPLKADERKLRYHLNDYLRFGGFPEVALKSDENVKLKLLEQYFESMLMRDVVERYQIRDVLSLKKAAVFGLTNIAKEFSYNSLRGSLKVSLDTAREYSSYLESAFILFQLPFFSYSMKEVMARNRKIYAVDTGLRNAVSKSFSTDYGRIMENAVYLHLRRRSRELSYWRDAGEVDFVLGGKAPEPINVTSGVPEPPREKKAMQDFMDKYKVREGTIITKDEGSEETLGKKTLKRVPLWEFLLDIDA
jgi:predicted AAA+ superfamily ATPase